MASKVTILIVSIVLLTSFVFMGLNLNFASSESIGGNVIVNDDPTGTSWQSLPDIAVDNNGKIHVVWLDDRDASRDVYYSNSTNGGASFNGSARVGDANDGGTPLKVSPEIAVDSNGKIHIAWHSHNGTTFNVYVANSTDGGLTFKTNSKIADNLPQIQLVPDIAVYGSNNVYVVWSDNRNSNSDIYFARSTDSGLNYGTNIKINDDAGSTVQGFSRVAVDSKGIIHVVWQDQRNGDFDIYYSNSTNSGVSFTANKNIAGGTSANEVESYITVDNNDNVYVSYTNNTGGFSNISLTKSTDAGDTWSTAVQVNDVIWNATQTYSSIAVNSTGKVFVAFEDNRSNPTAITPDIYIANSTNGGTSFGSDDIVNNDTGSNDHLLPKMAVGNDDSIYIIWADDRDSDYNIYLAKIQGESAVNNPPNIVTMTADPTIANPGGSSFINVTANDLDSDPLTYFYNVTGGSISGSGANVTWNAPLTPGVYNITAWVSDGKASSGTETVNVTVKAANNAPVIDNLTADKFTVGPGGESNLTVTAHDDDGDTLTYFYNTTGGYISGTGAAVKWTGPEINGTYKITAWVSDGLLLSGNLSINITVTGGTQFNAAPVVTNISAVPAVVEPSGVSNITVVASDADGDNLTYHYEVTGGSITGSGPNVTWTAPAAVGKYTVTAWVNDSFENSNKKSVNITVRLIALNHPPVVTSITADPTTVNINGTSTITVVASDEDGDELTYNYSIDGGELIGTGPIVTWKAPGSNGVFEIRIAVFDGLAESNTMGVNVTVTGGDNTAPVVDSISANSTQAAAGEIVGIDVVASDADGDPLTYIYEATAGIITGTGASVDWTAPETEGTYTITVKVNDGIMDSNTKSVDIIVSFDVLPNGTDAPDLVITDDDIVFSNPNPKEDENITITVTIHNEGTETVYNASVTVYSNTTLVGKDYVPVLAPKESKSVVFHYHFSKGKFLVEAKADEENYHVELDETNNNGKKEISVSGKTDGNGNGNGNGKDSDGKDSDDKSGLNPLFYILPLIIVIVIVLLYFLVIKKKKVEPPKEERVEGAEPVEGEAAPGAEEPAAAEEESEAPAAEPAAPVPEPAAEPAAVPEPVPAVEPAAPVEPTPQPDTPQPAVEETPEGQAVTEENVNTSENQG
jgi:hypothetical protein